MNIRIITAALFFATTLLSFACKQAEEKNIPAQETRIKHQITEGGFDHQFETKKGMKSELSMVGTTVDNPDGTYGYKERKCINIEFANTYDFNVFQEKMSIDSVYTYITDPDRSQTDFKVLEKGEDFLIYKAMEGDIPFHAVLVNVKVGDSYFSTVTEQIHFDMKNKPLVIGLEDCREVVKIMRSIKRAK